MLIPSSFYLYKMEQMECTCIKGSCSDIQKTGFSVCVADFKLWHFTMCNTLGDLLYSNCLLQI